MPIVRPDAWLGEVLNRQVYELSIPKAPVPAEAAVLLEEISAQKPVFIFARTNPVDVELHRFLESRAFHLIDTSLTFLKPVAVESTTLRSQNDDIEIRFARPGDFETVVETASKSFSYSRFHLDVMFQRREADYLKSRWVGNFFKGLRGDQMVVAASPQRCAGFLQLIIKDEVLIIDLIAVDPDFRRRGLAVDMIRFAESSIKGIKKYQVGTQLANMASIVLYQNYGFLLQAAKHIFHFHNT